MANDTHITNIKNVAKSPGHDGIPFVKPWSETLGAGVLKVSKLSNRSSNEFLESLYFL
jgi:hypothetical protein